MADESAEKPGASKSPRFMIIRVLVAIAAVSLLAWLLWRIGWTAIEKSFIQVGLGGAILLVLLGFSENMLDALAYRAAAPVKVPPFRMLSYNCAGALMNVAVPWDMGELVKIGFLRRHMGTSDAFSAALLWNFLLKSTKPLSTVIAAITGIALGSGAIPGNVALVILGATCLAFLPYLGIKLLIRLGLASLVARLLKLLRLGGPDPEKRLASALAFDSQIRGFWRDRRSDYLRLYIFQFAARLVAWLTWFAVLRLLGMPYGFGMCSLIYAGVSVATFVMMMLPARLGVAEGTAYLFFSLIGLDPGIGLIASVMLRLKMIIAASVPTLAVVLSPWKKP